MMQCPDLFFNRLNQLRVSMPQTTGGYTGHEIKILVSLIVG
jgi:hypothetical protein